MSNTVNFIELLIPEICTYEELVSALKQKDITVDVGASKVALLALYHKHIVPLPQRTYRANRRGLKMASSQQIINCRSRRSSEPPNQLMETAKMRKSEEFKTVGLVNDPCSSGDGPSITSHQRLQSCINLERKVISLKGSSQSTASTCGLNTGNAVSATETHMKATKRPADNQSILESPSKKLPRTPISWP